MPLKFRDISKMYDISLLHGHVRAVYIIVVKAKDKNMVKKRIFKLILLQNILL